MLSSSKRMQALLLLLAGLYLFRGVLVALDPAHGIDFPFFLTVGVGIALIPLVLLSAQPRRWFPLFMLILTVGALATNIIMAILNWQGFTVIALVSFIIIALWGVVLALTLTPGLRQSYAG